MSVRGLFIGAAGLGAQSDALSVTGDNIANSNTVGFKRSRANFEDILSRSLSGGSEIGMGSRLGSVQSLFEQGSMLGTGLVTDLAISGGGMFQVMGAEGSGSTGAFYTRAGQFQINSEGFLANPDGLRLQGFNADPATGTLSTQLTDVQLPDFEFPPTQTSSIEVGGNLDSASVEPAGAFDPTNAESTSNFSTSLTVYDSLGAPHSVTVYFRKDTAPGEWSWHALAAGDEVVGGTAGTPFEIGTGTLTFDTQGRLTDETGNIPVTFNGATAQTIDLDLGDSINTDGGTGLRGMTNYSGTSSTSFLNQDGSSSGALTGISVGSDGTITGSFSNGRNQTIAQVALAGFRNPEGLQRIGANLYIETLESGEPVVGEPGTSGRGLVNSGSLEQSNVDLAREFVDLIAYQRGFQANSRTVTTSDQVLQETLNLK